MAKTDLLAVSIPLLILSLATEPSFMQREPVPIAEAVAERAPLPEQENVEERICRWSCL